MGLNLKIRLYLMLLFPIVTGVKVNNIAIMVDTYAGMLPAIDLM